MKVIYDIFENNYIIEKAYVAVGNFDGVHIGHKKLIENAVKRAKEHGGVSVVFSFLNHPKEITNNKEVPLLINTVEEKIYLLEKMGVDYLVLQPFTKEFCKLSGEEFVEKILKNSLNSKKVYVGFNFGFGEKRAHGVASLKSMCKKHNIQVKEIGAVKVDDKIISSTLIRKLIMSGELSQVNHYLGEPYLIVGKVVHGKKIGREMGFPTANLNMAEKVQFPYGVYGATVKIEDSGEELDAILNIGKNPTLKPGTKSIEVHILDFNEDIYGKILYLRVIKNIRTEVKFASMEELKERIKKDILDWRTYLKNLENGEDCGNNS